MTHSHQQVENLFTAALEREGAEQRRQFLEEACHGDAALRERVEMLLDSYAAAKDFLEEPAAEWTAADADDPEESQWLGRAVSPADQAALVTPSNVDASNGRRSIVASWNSMRAARAPENFPRACSSMWTFISTAAMRPTWSISARE